MNRSKIEKMMLKGNLRLDCGRVLKDCEVAFKTYGKLNKKKSNAILICHALTGDQFCSGINPITKRHGWWNQLVGPNKIIDTKIFFIICCNVLGGCMGSTGPSSINPDTNKPYGLSFPVITIGDMVSVQEKLVNNLGINKLFAVVGGSMGGMQTLEWAVRYPDKLNAVVPIATSFRHSAQNIALHEIGRQAIMADPNWCNGNYYSWKINFGKYACVLN